MSTIQQLKTNHDTVIRQKTLPKSISTDNQADLFDGLADELLDRGFTQVADTTALQALSGTNYKNVVVKDNGIYLYKSSGTPNGSTIFAATGGGVYEKQFALQSLIIDVTYSELVDLIDDSELIPEVKYKITDFATRHFLIGNYGQDISVAFTGTTEPLIVTAIDVNKLDKATISPLYPQDIIYYDWDPANWLTDVGFSDITAYNYVDPNTATIISNFKGVIYYREDTYKNNITNYDFRNVKFRRYAHNSPIFTDSLPYSQYTVVSSSGLLYMAKLNVLVGSVITDETKWLKLFTDLNTNYINSNKTTNNTKIPVNSLDFIDMLTFSGNYAAFINNKVYYIDDAFNYNESGTILSNNVFYHAGNGLVKNNNIINSYSNTFLNVCDKNNVYKSRYSIYHKVVGNEFKGNASVTESTFTEAYYNKIGVILNSFFGFNFNNNDINNISTSSFGSNSNNNIITNITDCEFKNNFQNNTMMYPCVLLNTNFSSSTLVYIGYSKIISMNSSGVNRLSYINGSDVLTIANPTD